MEKKSILLWKKVAFRQRNYALGNNCESRLLTSTMERPLVSSPVGMKVREGALASLLSTIFILFVWFFGVTAFAGPVMVLVVIPIERMVRLLGMLMLDPLGYQSTSRYKRFVDEENEITKNTRWTKEILKGMETSFLMSTILAYWKLDESRIW